MRTPRFALASAQPVSLRVGPGEASQKQRGRRSAAARAEGLPTPPPPWQTSTQPPRVSACPRCPLGHAHRRNANPQFANGMLIHTYSELAQPRSLPSPHTLLFPTLKDTHHPTRAQ